MTKQAHQSRTRKTRLTVPQFCVNAVLLQQIPMGPHLRHMTILQYEDLIAVVDRPETMRDKDAGALLLFQNAVDVLQQRLFCVGV